jgi:hypothetical protein
MTDIEVLREMFTRAGVVWTEELREKADADDVNLAGIPAGTTLEVMQGNDLDWDDPPPRPRNFGYCDFYTDFYFDEHGALYGVGAWE